MKYYLLLKMINLRRESGEHGLKQDSEGGYTEEDITKLGNVLI